MGVQEERGVGNDLEVVKVRRKSYHLPREGNECNERAIENIFSGLIVHIEVDRFLKIRG